MCGIIGIIGVHEAAPRLVEGLRRLEYRGYDSAGVATLSGGEIDRRRAEGKLVNLENRLKDQPLPGLIGVGHTRWATHGGPTENNAHPHATPRVAVVHNGIIENYQELKEELQAQGAVFESATDTEVIAHLVTYYMDKEGLAPKDAARAAFMRFSGAFSLVLLFTGHEDMLIGGGVWRRGDVLRVRRLCAGPADQSDLLSGRRRLGDLAPRDGGNLRH